MASSRWWMIRHRWLGRHFHPFFLDLDHWSNHLLQPLCSTAFSCRCSVHHQQLGRLLHLFFLTWCDKQSCQARLRPSNRGRWFHVWRSFVRQAHCYDNQWNLALMEAGVVSKMWTPAIPFLFPKKWLFGFFILEKQLSSQKYISRNIRTFYYYLSLSCFLIINIFIVTIVSQNKLRLFCVSRNLWIIKLFLKRNSLGIAIHSQK